MVRSRGREEVFSTVPNQMGNSDRGPTSFSLKLKQGSLTHQRVVPVAILVQFPLCARLAANRDASARHLEYSSLQSLYSGLIRS